MTEQPTITLLSDVLADGSYGIVIHDGADTVRGLSREEAYDHAAAVLTAAQRAEYDAAVFQQLNGKLGLPLDTVAEAIRDLRSTRAPLDPNAMHPIGLEPLVTSQGKPFLILSVNGRRVCQWTPADARRHAAGALELAEAVRLDSDYFTWLTNDAGVEEPRARNVVDDLANHRPNATEAAQ